MSMWSDFYGDHIYEIEVEGVDPHKLYWSKILGIDINKPLENKKNVNKKRTDGWFSVLDNINKWKRKKK